MNSQMMSVYTLVCKDAMHIAQDTLQFTTESSKLPRCFLRRRLAKGLCQVTQQSRTLHKCRTLYLTYKAYTIRCALTRTVMQAALRQVLKAYGIDTGPCLPPMRDSSAPVRTYTNPRKARNWKGNWKALNCECQRQRHKHRVLNLQRAQERLKLLFDTDQARANKIVNQQGDERTNLSVTQESQRRLITSLQGRSEVAHTFFQRLAPVPKIRPDRGIPWSLRLDYFEIATEATHAPPIITVLTMMQDVNKFCIKVRGLSNKKAPGPD